MAAARIPDQSTHPGSGDPAPGGVPIAPGIRVPDAALRFAFSRASGPGGQNVNKVSTRAELRIDIEAIPLPGRAKARLRRIAGSRIVGAQTFTEETPDGRTREVTRGGELIITSGEHRSQSQNKSECMDRLRELLIEAMHEPKPRRATRPTRGSVERRITEKKSRSETKKRRSSGDHD
jgi:ribosome-associated protein